MCLVTKNKWINETQVKLHAMQCLWWNLPWFVLRTLAATLLAVEPKRNFARRWRIIAAENRGGREIEQHARASHIWHASWRGIPQTDQSVWSKYMSVCVYVEMSLHLSVYAFGWATTYTHTHTHTHTPRGSMLAFTWTLENYSWDTALLSECECARPCAWVCMYVRCTCVSKNPVRRARSIIAYAWLWIE